MTTEVTSKEKHQFFQRRIDVIDTEKLMTDMRSLMALIQAVTFLATNF